MAQISKVLVVPDEEDINPLRPVSAYGADSLAAVELKGIGSVANWMLRFGVMEILSGKSIERLAGKVAQKSKLVLLGKD